MTGPTKVCERCEGSAKVAFRHAHGEWDTDVCPDCDWGRVPLTEAELEAQGQVSLDLAREE